MARLEGVNLSQLCSARPDGPQIVTGGAGIVGSDLHEFFTSERASVRALLARHGALLFRGFELHEPWQFAQCMAALGLQPFCYTGGDSPRTVVSDGVYTSTEYPATASISLHHEMSYLSRWPTVLAFFAVTAPLANGQTSLAITADVSAAIDPEVVRRFHERGLKYVRIFHTGMAFGKSWQETFGTSDRGKVQLIVKDLGSDICWIDTDTLQLETYRSALLDLDGSGRFFWFNQAEQWHPSALSPQVRQQFSAMLGNDLMPHDCKYGDGSEIPPEDLRGIRKAMAGAKLLFDWQAGDLLILDNRLMMHGREPFAGERRILAYLGA